MQAERVVSRQVVADNLKIISSIGQVRKITRANIVKELVTTVDQDFDNLQPVLSKILEAAEDGQTTTRVLTMGSKTEAEEDYDGLIQEFDEVVYDRIYDFCSSLGLKVRKSHDFNRKKGPYAYDHHVIDVSWDSKTED